MKQNPRRLTPLRRFLFSLRGSKALVKTIDGESVKAKIIDVDHRHLNVLAETGEGIKLIRGNYIAEIEKIGEPACEDRE